MKQAITCMKLEKYIFFSFAIKIKMYINEFDDRDPGQAGPVVIQKEKPRWTF